VDRRCSAPARVDEIEALPHGHPGALYAPKYLPANVPEVGWRQDCFISTPERFRSDARVAS